MINEYLIFVILAITVTSIPGPAVILTIKNSIKYRYRGAIASIIGNFTAMLILASISAAGVGAIILSSTLLFSILKVIGCLYLAYIGVAMWRKSPADDALLCSTKNKEKTVLLLFREGFIVGISNPKAITFFTALFPQFIDPARAVVPQFLVLIFTIEGISFLVLSTYAIIASIASSFFAANKTMMLFNRFCGAALIGFGVALIYNDRTNP